MHDFQEHCQTVFQGTDQFFLLQLLFKPMNNLAILLFATKAKLILLINPLNNTN